jgi:hypothetical protein
MSKPPFLLSASQDPWSDSFMAQSQLKRVKMNELSFIFTKKYHPPGAKSNKFLTLCRPYEAAAGGRYRGAFPLSCSVFPPAYHSQLLPCNLPKGLLRNAGYH